MTLRRSAIALVLTAATLAGCSSPDLPTTPGRARALAGSGAPGAAATSGAPAIKSGKCDYTPAVGSDEPSVKAAIKDVGKPPATARTSGKATMRMTTSQGEIVIDLDVKGSPCTVNSFVFLGGKHFFDTSKCHRLTTQGIWVLQCGDPSGTGYGGPSYGYASENTNLPYTRGTVAIANSGQPNSNGSQFFINYKDNPLPADYARLGTVTSGMEVVDKVAAGGVNPADPANPGDGAPKVEIVLQSVTIAYQ